jgi:acetone carboxylase gamma subunit
MAPETTNPDEHLLPVKHSSGDLFICDVADAALKDLNPQMEHPFCSLWREWKRHAGRRKRGAVVIAFWGDRD